MIISLGILIWIGICVLCLPAAISKINRLEEE